MSRHHVENLIAVLRSHVPHCAKLDGDPRCSSDCEHDPELADGLQALLEGSIMANSLAWKIGVALGRVGDEQTERVADPLAELDELIALAAANTESERAHP